MMLSTRARIGAACMAAALALTGCASLPVAPPPLPSTFVPEVEATLPEPGIPVGDDGFTVVERIAMRVTVEACNAYRNGSAWVLDENTVVTNRHVVEGAVSIDFTSYDGTRYEGTTSVISETQDLALVTIDGALPEAAQLASAQPGIGDEVFVVGYPEAGRLTTSEGTFMGEAPESDDLDTTGAYLITAPTLQGSSGSPAVDATGAVVGVVFASDEVTSTVIVSLESLRNFLDNPDEQVSNEPDCG